MCDGLVAAVDYIHRQGFVHRDIKENNVTVHPSTWRLKLIDFGGARHVPGPLQRRPTTPTSQVTTCTHRPPAVNALGEIGNDPPCMDPISIDVWSTTCVLLFIISGGERLVRYNADDELTDVVDKRRIPSINKLQSSIERLIKNCTGECSVDPGNELFASQASFRAYFGCILERLTMTGRREDIKQDELPNSIYKS